MATSCRKLWANILQPKDKIIGNEEKYVTAKNVSCKGQLKVFKASLGLPGGFLKLSVGFLINDITY